MTVTRRQFVVAGAAVAAAGAILPARSDTMPLVLIDPSLTAEARRSLPAGTRITLAANLVRQWRDGLGARTGRSGAEAFVRWDKALVLKGLAREHRQRAQVTPFRNALFRVSLSPQQSRRG